MLKSIDCDCQGLRRWGEGGKGRRELLHKRLGTRSTRFLHKAPRYKAAEGEAQVSALCSNEQVLQTKAAEKLLGNIQVPFSILRLFSSVARFN